MPLAAYWFYASSAPCAFPSLLSRASHSSWFQLQTSTPGHSFRIPFQKAVPQPLVNAKATCQASPKYPFGSSQQTGFHPCEVFSQGQVVWQTENASHPPLGHWSIRKGGNEGRNLDQSCNCFGSPDPTKTVQKDNAKKKGAMDPGVGLVLVGF